MVQHLVEPPDAFGELVEVGGPRLLPVVHDGSFAQQHLELVALKALQPTGDTPHDVDGLQRTIAQDVDVVILAKEGSSLTPSILGCIDGLGPEFLVLLRQPWKVPRGQQRALIAIASDVLFPLPEAHRNLDRAPANQPLQGRVQDGAHGLASITVPCAAVDHTHYWQQLYSVGGQATHD